MGNILHIVLNDKFIYEYINMVNKNFDANEHHFIVYGDLKNYRLPKFKNIQLFSSKLQAGSVLMKMYKSDKIMLHSFPHNFALYLLFTNPWLLRKCYWIIWGFDLYFQYYKKRNGLSNYIKNIIRKHTIRRCANVITYVKGDYELARKWYDFNGKYYECIIYPTNIFDGQICKHRKDNIINIQVGNSADPTNNHLGVFKILEKYKDFNIHIYIPLTYGDKNNAIIVNEVGRKIFKDKITILTKHLSYDDYKKYLSLIDIAIFNHNRQQAMGNIINLLGLGKKVYMNKGLSHWALLNDMGIKLFDINNFELELINENDAVNNYRIVKSCFNLSVLIKQWQYIFMN